MGVSWVAVGQQQDNKEADLSGKRASPNKAADSGFSDSGDSEASPCPGGVRGHQGGNHVSRVHLSGREEEHYQSPSSLPITKVAKQTTSGRKKKGGKRRSGDELSRGSKGSPVVLTETKSCNEEAGSELLLLPGYKSGLASFSCPGAGKTHRADAENASSFCSTPPPPPPPPHQRPPSISGSASISLSSPAFSNFSETSFQNFSETSSRNGDLSSGSSPTQAALR